MFVDAKGKPCPTPVIMAKKALNETKEDVVVAVDNEIAVENLCRLGNSLGLPTEKEQIEGGFQVHFHQDGVQPLPQVELVSCCETPAAGYAVFIGKDTLGAGSDELGGNLMKMALYTLSQGDTVPESILFMNGGVKLPSGEEQQVIDSLKELESRGSKILVCGTCLNYFGLTEQLKVGTVSNMYDILGSMQAAAKVISL